MRADMRAKASWQARNYRHFARHMIEEEHLPYITELMRPQTAVQMRVLART